MIEILGGRVEISKNNQDTDNAIKQQSFQVNYEGDRPTIAFKKYRIDNCKDPEIKSALQNSFQKRLTYSQEEYNRQTLQKRRTHTQELANSRKEKPKLDNDLQYQGRKCKMFYDKFLKMNRLAVVQGEAIEKTAQNSPASPLLDKEYSLKKRKSKKESQADGESEILVAKAIEYNMSGETLGNEGPALLDEKMK